MRVNRSCVPKGNNSPGIVKQTRDINAVLRKYQVKFELYLIWALVDKHQQTSLNTAESFAQGIKKDGLLCEPLTTQLSAQLKSNCKLPRSTQVVLIGATLSMEVKSILALPTNEIRPSRMTSRLKRAVPTDSPSAARMVTSPPASQETEFWLSQRSRPKSLKLDGNKTVDPGLGGDSWTQFLLSFLFTYKWQTMNYSCKEKKKREIITSYVRETKPENNTQERGRKNK